ncbi:hypothetical protein MRX96_032344 [Rhipicephalus microplus]
MVHLQMRQLHGLSDAFENATLDTSQELTNISRALLFSLVGDFIDLEAALRRPEDLYSLSLVPACSALIKVVGNTGLEGVIPGHTITMSSYAGKLVSLDDFYLTSAGLLLYSIRSLLWQLALHDSARLTFWAHSFSPGGATDVGAYHGGDKAGHIREREWVDLFARNNSGTYNNQWMIVDYKLFKPGTAILNDTLWILEQMPGITRQRDVSDILRKQSYWPSYNVAYFDDIFVISGQTALVEKYGDYYSYDKTARANIFRRDHVNVTDLGSMTWLMR